MKSCMPFQRAERGQHEGSRQIRRSAGQLPRSIASSYSPDVTTTSSLSELTNARMRIFKCVCLRSQRLSPSHSHQRSRKGGSRACWSRINISRLTPRFTYLRAGYFKGQSLFTTFPLFSRFSSSTADETRYNGERRDCRGYRDAGRGYFTSRPKTQETVPQGSSYVVRVPILSYRIHSS